MEFRNRLLKQYIAENIFRTTDDGRRADDGRKNIGRKKFGRKKFGRKNSDEKKIGGKARGQGTAAAEARHG